MIMTALIIPICLAVLACTALSLRIRWSTWSCPWEQASTVAVALLGAGVVLTLFLGLFQVIGHVCIMLAAASIAVAALSRIDGDTRTVVQRWIVRPLGATLLAMAGCLVLGNGVTAELDGRPWSNPVWLNVYGAVMTLALVYLLGFASAALMVLRGDERQRPMATLFLIPCAAGLAASLGQCLVLFMLFTNTGRGGMLSVVAQLSLVAAGIWIAGFALSAAHSWHLKTKGFRNLQRALRS